ncbi:MAG: hypothetical protein U0989_08265 [Azonexus sp.]|nr:hypothetical protein [Azonexus sp.]
MDIHDIYLKYDISKQKLRRMEKGGVLRVGKSELPKHWQMVRTDIRKGKLSARSIALAYRLPKFVDSIIDLSSSQRSMIGKHFVAANLPENIPAPDEDISSMAGLICGAATEGGHYLDRFIRLVQALIPNKEVGYDYVAVRILLMAKNEYDIDGAFHYLRRALLKAKDKPEMAGWWRSEKTGGASGTRTIYHRPKVDFDL